MADKAMSRAGRSARGDSSGASRAKIDELSAKLAAALADLEMKENPIEDDDEMTADEKRAEMERELASVVDRRVETLRRDMEEELEQCAADLKARIKEVLHPKPIVQRRRQFFHEKEFKHRNSILSLMLSQPHFQSIYHIFLFLLPDFSASMSNFISKGGSRLTAKTPTPQWGASTEPLKKSTSASSVSLRRSGQYQVQRKTHIPGYTGHINNSEEVAGRPYSRGTARALNNDIYKLAIGDQIPSGPHVGRKIPVCGDTKLSTTLVGKFQGKLRHVPGYTGHVTDTRWRFGETYGQTTGRVLKRPIVAKEDRRAMNRASLERFSYPASTVKPEITVRETGLNLKYCA